MEYSISKEELQQQFESEQQLPYNLFEYDFYEKKYLKEHEISPLIKFTYKDFVGNRLQNPIESKLDKAFIKLTKSFKTKDSAQRSKIRSSFSEKDFNLVLVFLERASVFVLRGKKEYLEAAMVTMAMIDFARGDHRYTCMSFAFVRHVIENSPNKNKFYKLAIDLANFSTRNYLQLVQNELMILEKDFGYTPYNFKNGLGFISCMCCGGFEKDNYQPNKNLYKIVIEIKSHLQKIKLKSFSSIELTTKSPFLLPSNYGEYASVINGMVRLSLSYVLKERIIYNLYFQITEFKTAETANAYLQLLGNEKNESYNGYIFNRIGYLVYTIYGKSTNENTLNKTLYPNLQKLKKSFEGIIKLG